MNFLAGLIANVSFEHVKFVFIFAEEQPQNTHRNSIESMAHENLSLTISGN